MKASDSKDPTSSIWIALQVRHKDASLNFLSAMALLDMEKTEDIHPHVVEGWLIRSGLQQVSHQLFHDTFMSFVTGYAGVVYMPGQRKAFRMQNSDAA